MQLPYYIHMVIKQGAYSVSNHACFLHILYSSIYVYLSRQFGNLMPEEWHLFILKFISRAIIINIQPRGGRHVFACFDDMPHTCCFVSGCSNHSNCDTNWNHHCLPLKNKPWLCLWIHELGRSNLPLKLNTHACSDHFGNSCSLELRVDKNPTLRLPKLSTSWMLPKKRKAPRLPKLSTSRTSLKKAKSTDNL